MGDYYNLGTYSRKVTTQSAEAQRWFDRGLMWIYGYNFETAVACFRKALAVDPTCVMAYWGSAYGMGCNYNKEWRFFPPPMIARAMQQAREAIYQGYAHVDKVTPVEAALIQALEKRFQAEGAHEEALLQRWNDDYTNAMRLVYQQYPDDWDVAALFAEALINRTPWQLWDLKSGRPAEGADTEETIAVLERALAQVEIDNANPHPGLIHMYIHVMEMSPHPEKALRAADMLRELVPDAGHLKHMPSHIDILCGHYYEAVAANNRAIEADKKFVARDGENNEYTHYRAHNIHFKIYAAMMMGQYKTAIAAANDMLALAHEGVLRLEQPPLAYFLESMVSMKLHVLIRFGKWRDILQEPFPEDKELYCNTTSMLHYARAIAYATLGNFASADAERKAFEVARKNLHEYRYLVKNTCADVLKVAEAMMNGEIEYHKGNYEVAFDYLRQAVYLDNHLKYMEPWAWMMPTRHALGALLLVQERVEEAAAVYRADLGLDNTVYRAMQHPDNVWSLHGYVTCLRKQGKHGEAAALQNRLNIALARADVEINASCFCAVKRSEPCCH